MQSVLLCNSSSFVSVYVLEMAQGLSGIKTRSTVAAALNSRRHPVPHPPWLQAVGSRDAGEGPRLLQPPREPAEPRVPVDWLLRQPRAGKC